MNDILDTNMGRVVVIGTMHGRPDGLRIGVTRYVGPDGGPGRVCLLAVYPHGEVYGKLSVNLVDAHLAPEEFAVNHDLTNDDVEGMLKSDAGISDTGITSPSGWVDFRIFRLATVPPLPKPMPITPSESPEPVTSAPDPKPGDRWSYEEGPADRRSTRWIHVARVVHEPSPWSGGKNEERVYTVTGAYLLRQGFDATMATKCPVAVPLGAHPDDFVCRECGGTFNTGYWSGGTELREKRLCLSDDHWTKCWYAVRSGRSVVVHGCVYTPEPDRPEGYEGFVGFGGARFTIRRADGSIFVTRNLWSQGDVPAQWRERLADNAEFVNPAPEDVHP